MRGRKWSFLVLLRLAAELHDDRRDHARPERQDRRRAGVGALLLEDVLLDGIPARPAEFLRPGVGHPALPVQRLVPAQVIVLLEALALDDFLAEVLGQIGAHERAHVLAEFLFVGGELEVHRGGSGGRPASIGAAGPSNK
jgi:hypothetical protein